MREFTFSATISLPSPSSDLKVPNVALTLAYVTRVHNYRKRVLSVDSLHCMIQSDV